MKILIHGPYPEMPTGFANQIRVWAPRIAKAGHEVALSCTAGIVRHNTEWRGLKVYGRGPYTDVAEDLVRSHYADFGADLVITLCDPWVMHGHVWASMRTIHLMTIDCSPLGHRDFTLLEAGGSMPAAVTRFGESVLRARGLDPLFLPHGVDTSFWKPPRERAKMRRAMGIDQLFVAGINASNTDSTDRKAFGEQFQAFAEFHGKHPKSLLAVHAARLTPDGLNLEAMAADLDITDAVIFSDQYQLASAGAPEEALVAWYGSLDVLLNASRGEGYGLAIAEAQACGTPVITGSWSGQSSIAGPACWQCAGQKEWCEVHHAWWRVPLVKSLAGILERAYNGCGSERRTQARRYAETELDADLLFAKHWLPVLQELDS